VLEPGVIWRIRSAEGLVDSGLCSYLGDELSLTAFSFSFPGAWDRPDNCWPCGISSFDGSLEGKLVRN
jgi:hypothetical protein